MDKLRLNYSHANTVRGRVMEGRVWAALIYDRRIEKGERSWEYRKSFCESGLLQVLSFGIHLI